MTSDDAADREGEGRGEVPGAPAPLRFPLRPPPLLSPGVQNLVLASVAFALAIGQPVLGEVGQPLALLPLVLATAAVPVLLAWIFRPRLPPGAIEVFLDRVAFPLPGGAIATVRAREITELHLREGRRRGHLWVGTEAGTLLYELARFESDAAARRLLAALRARVAALPDADRRLPALAARSAIAGFAELRPARGSKVAVGLLLLVGVAQHALGAFATPSDVVRFGAGARLLVAEGQLWRLASASFLHHELHVHLYLNALAILGLGAVVERLLGAAAFWLVFLASSLAGAGASALLGDGPTVSLGASTAAYGLLGAFAFTVGHYRGRLPLGFHPPASWWGLLVLVNLLLLGAVGELIDMSAHFGGFLAGVVVAGLLVAGDPPLPVEGPAPPLARAALAVLFAVTAAGLLRAGVEVVRGDPADADRVLAAQVAHLRSSPEAQNALAWRIATSPLPRPAQLELAERAGLRALDGARDAASRAAFADTLATVLVRRGALDRAIALERQAWSEGRDNEAFYVSQLASMLAIEARHLGGSRRDPALARTEVRLEAHRLEARVGFSLALSPPPAEAVTALAWARRRDDPAGRPLAVVRAFHDPALAAQDTYWLPPELSLLLAGADLELELLSLERGAGGWSAWPVDPRVVALPRARVVP